MLRDESPNGLGSSPWANLSNTLSYSCRLSLFPELLNHDINTLLLHMQAHIVVIDEHDGGIPTRAHALGLSQGNQTVLGCLPIVNAQLFLEILTRTHPIAQSAG